MAGRRLAMLMVMFAVDAVVVPLVNVLDLEAVRAPDTNVSQAANSTFDTAPVTLEEKRVTEAESATADRVLNDRELARDEAWQNARGSLAVASDPPIRSAAVFDMLKAETNKFAELEGAIKAAKVDATRKRRISELAGSAWDAHETLKLKQLRESAAEAALRNAHAAVGAAQRDELELLRELKIERNRERAS